jgi:hypothetical protein
MTIFIATSVVSECLLRRGRPVERGEVYQNRNLCPSKRLARSVAFVGKQAPAAGARAAMTWDVCVGCQGGLLGQLLPPQLFHARADRFEIVSYSGLCHQTLPAPP